MQTLGRSMVYLKVYITYTLLIHKNTNAKKKLNSDTLGFHVIKHYAGALNINNV